MKKLFLLIIIAVLLSGCSSSNNVQDLNSSWVMYRLSGAQLNKDLLTKGLPEFRFDLSANRFSGHAGCNQLSSDISVKDDEITFGRIIRTEMACPHMEAENIVINVLNENTLHFDIDDPWLTLTAPDGTEMVFKRDLSN